MNITCASMLSIFCRFPWWRHRFDSCQRTEAVCTQCSRAEKEGCHTSQLLFYFAVYVSREVCKQTNNLCLFVYEIFIFLFRKVMMTYRQLCRPVINLTMQQLCRSWARQSFCKNVRQWVLKSKDFVTGFKTVTGLSLMWRKIDCCPTILMLFMSRKPTWIEFYVN